MIDPSLNEFDEDGRQTVFAISPRGASETRAERLARWERTGTYDPACPGCAGIAEHPTLDPFQPRHRASRLCRSGGRNHCTCDACF